MAPPFPDRERAALPAVDLTTHPSPHPFVRRGLVARSPRRLPEGALVQLRDPMGQALGEGFWNGTSDIALRRLTSGSAPFDRPALVAAVERAATLRERLPGLLEESEAWRVVHAEGDGLSGLVVDRFGEVLVLELHSAGWLPLLDELLPLLHERLGTRHHRVELSPRTAHLEGVAPLSLASDDCPRRVRVRENGLRWEVDLDMGHKTGFFCDQRENRAALARQVAGRHVLDLCSCTGGFAVTAAARGQPASVTAVELDEVALAQARVNANLNQCRVAFTRADAFDWLRQVHGAQRTFGAVVLDPPKFIPSRREEERGRARYHDLNRLAVKVLEPGGLLVSCSCSGLLARDELLALVRTALRKEGREATIVAVTGAAPDHPVHLECPEGEYLKVLWMIVR